jgi:hypothetical protein
MALQVIYRQCVGGFPEFEHPWTPGSEVNSFMTSSGLFFSEKLGGQPSLGVVLRSKTISAG